MKIAPTLIALFFFILISCQNREMVIDCSSHETFIESNRKITYSMTFEEAYEYGFYMRVVVIDSVWTPKEAIFWKDFSKPEGLQKVKRLDGLTAKEIQIIGREIEKGPDSTGWKERRKIYYERVKGQLELFEKSRGLETEEILDMKVSEMGEAAEK